MLVFHKWRWSGCSNPSPGRVRSADFELNVIEACNPSYFKCNNINSNYIAVPFCARSPHQKHHTIVCNTITLQWIGLELRIDVVVLGSAMTGGYHCFENDTYNWFVKRLITWKSTGIRHAGYQWNWRTRTSLNSVYESWPPGFVRPAMDTK